MWKQHISLQTSYFCKLYSFFLNLLLWALFPQHSFSPGKEWFIGNIPFGYFEAMISLFPGLFKSPLPVPKGLWAFVQKAEDGTGSLFTVSRWLPQNNCGPLAMSHVENCPGPESSGSADWEGKMKRFFLFLCLHSGGILWVSLRSFICSFLPSFINYSRAFCTWQILC